MGGLIGFLLGFYTGAKAGPESIDELRKSFVEVLQSRDVQALIAGAEMLVRGSLQRAESAKPGGREDDPADVARAVRTIVESEEFRALVATGTAVFQGFLAQGRATFGDRGNGSARSNA